MLAHRLHRALIHEEETLPGHPGSRVSIPGRGTQTHTFGFPKLTRQTSDFGEAKEANADGLESQRGGKCTDMSSGGQQGSPSSPSLAMTCALVVQGRTPSRQGGVEGGAGSTHAGAQRGQKELVFCHAQICSKTCRPVPSERGKQCLGEKEKDSRQKAGCTRGDKKHPKMVNVWVDIKDFYFSFKKFL